MSAPNELSFLPEDYLEQKYKRRANIVCAALVLVVVAGVIVAWQIKGKQHARVQAEFTQVNNEYVDAARQIEQVKKMQAEQRELFRHAEITASLKERVPRSNILANITNALPAGVSLIDLSMTSNPHENTAPAGSSFDQRRAQIQAQSGAGARPSEFDIHLHLTGIAADDIQVAQLISRLSHDPMFQDVNLIVSDTYSQTRTDNSSKTDLLRRWQLEMMINPLAEVRDDTKTAAVELAK